MRQRAGAHVGLVGQSAQAQKLSDARRHRRPRLRAKPGPQAIAGRDLDRDADVVGDRELGKDLGDLEGAGHAAPHPLVGSERSNVAALEPDRARGRREQAADQIEERRLAGAVRTDDRAQFARLDGQRHVVDGDQAAKALRCALDLKQGHAFAPLRSMPRTPRGKKRTTSTNTRPITDIQFWVWLET